MDETLNKDTTKEVSLNPNNIDVSDNDNVNLEEVNVNLDNASVCNYKQKGKKRAKFIVMLVVCCLLALALINTIVVRCCFIPVEVVGDSMNDTLKDGDILYVVKNGNVKRGDIVIIEGEKENDIIIKRIVAKQGDMVKLVDGELLIKYDGTEEFVPIDSKNAKIPQDFKYSSTWLDENGYTLTEDEYFYLGDNRANSSDSLSSYKTCSGNQILGRSGNFLVSVKGFTSFVVKTTNYFRTFLGFNSVLS